MICKPINSINGVLVNPYSQAPIPTGCPTAMGQGRVATTQASATPVFKGSQEKHTMTAQAAAPEGCGGQLDCCA